MAKEDIRNIRTKKVLRDALTDLLNVKSFDKISVNEIATKAALSRITFYKHYKDKYDLLADVIMNFSNTIYTETINESNKNLIGTPLECSLEFLQKCILACNSKQNILESIIQADGTLNSLVVKNVVEEIVRQMVNDLATVYKPNYHTDVISAILVGAVANYLFGRNKNKTFNKEDFDVILRPLLTDMITKVLFTTATE